jgi:hypothetical protein
LPAKFLSLRDLSNSKERRRWNICKHSTRTYSRTSIPRWCRYGRKERSFWPIALSMACRSSHVPRFVRSPIPTGDRVKDFQRASIPRRLVSLFVALGCRSPHPCGGPVLYRE